MISESGSLDSRSWSHNVPPLSALAAFEAIVRLGSFAAAARELNRTPSAISHAIRELERRAGMPLFVRRGRSVSPTRLGEAYARDVEQAIDALKRGARTLRLHADEPLIRISAPPLFVATVLIPGMVDFESRHPPHRLHIETTNRIADFDDSEIDVGIRFAPVTEEHLHSRPLPAVRRVPVCAPQFADRHDIRSIEDLARVDLIQVAQAPDSWSAFFASCGVGAEFDQRVTVFDSTTSALEAARRGLGVALAIFPLVAAYPGYGSELIRIGRGWAADAEGYRMVYREISADSRKIQLFGDWLHQSMSDMEQRYGD